MDPIDTLNLDRTVARAAREARRFLRQLRLDPQAAAEDRWFAACRPVTTRTAFAAVSELAPTDPLREGARRWVYALALARIAMPALVNAASARNAREVRVERPHPGQYSVREIVRRALAEPVADKRQRWLEGLTDAGDRPAAAERRLADAIGEITGRLEVDDAAPLRMPYTRASLARAAREVLAATRDRAREAFASCRGLGDLVGVLLAREVQGVWPARPGARWIEDTFAATPLLDGLDLDLGPLPPAFGAASMVRMLARFGAAHARAAALGAGGPFVIASDATDAHPLRRGALFGALLADPTFLRWRLGFSRETAAAVGRALAKTLLGAARIEAVRSLFDVATAPARDLAEAFEDALCVRYPSALCGILPRPCPAAPNRLAGMLLAVADQRALVEQFDEDWFRNPRALAHLRELDARPSAPTLADDALAGAPAAFASALEARLG